LQPAERPPPIGGAAPNCGFLLQANQLAFVRWLNGVNVLSQMMMSLDPALSGTKRRPVAMLADGVHISSFWEHSAL
jgi:hypothetical protein